MTSLTSTRSRGGKRRAVPPAEAAARVPLDVRWALAAALRAAGEEFRPTEWDYTLAGAVTQGVRRRTPRGQGRDLAAISSDCRLAWVPAGEDPDDVAAQLAATGSLMRGEIELVLDSHLGRARKAWLVEPLPQGLGWLCRRAGRSASRAAWLVTPARQVRSVEPHLAPQVLAALLQGNHLD